MKFFIDANVLIDFILERPLFYPPAAMIVSYAVEKRLPFVFLPCQLSLQIMCVWIVAKCHMMCIKRNWIS